MNIGMLWFDNDTTTNLNAKVTRAAQYYEKKYAKKPNLCFVHPCMVTGNNGDGAPIATGDGVEIRESVTLLPNHFWIGVHNPQPPEDDWKTRRRDAERFEMDMEGVQP